MTSNSWVRREPEVTPISVPSIQTFAAESTPWKRSSTFAPESRESVQSAGTVTVRE